MDVTGKSCLVTGGARGFGKAFAAALLDKGANVCILDMLEDVLSETEKEFASKYGAERVLAAKCDVTKQEQFEAAFEKAVKVFGGLDLMVNNAGVHGFRPKDLIYNVNMHGLIRGTDLAIEHMHKQRGGRGGLILNVCSTLGLYGIGIMPEYSASKHGAIGYTRSRAFQLGASHGIEFRVLCPTACDTDLHNEVKTQLVVSDTAFPPDLHGMNNDSVEIEDVVRGFMLLIENKSLPQGAVIKVVGDGIFHVRPELMPCEKL